MPAPRREFALPKLGGRRSNLFQIVWAAVLLLTVAAMAVGNYRSYVRSTDRPFGHVGLGWYEDRGEMRLRPPYSREARASGLREGDRIIAIDRVPVGSDLGSAPGLDRRLKGPEGSMVELTVRSDDGRTSTHRLTRTRRHLDEGFAGSGLTAEVFRWMTLSTDLLPDLFLFIAAVLLFRGRREEPVCALLSVSLLLMVATGGGAWSFWDTATFAKVRDALSTVSALGITTALLAFPDGRFGSRWSTAALAAAFLWAAVSLSFLQAGLLVGFGWVIVLAGALAVVAHRYRQLPEGQARQQIRWVLLGFGWGTILLLLTSLLGTIASLIPDSRTSVALWLGLSERVLAALGVACFAAGLLVSLLRYRLYDVDQVISRSAAYGLLTVGFVAVFAGSQKIIETLGERFLETGSGALSGGVAAAIGAAAIVPLHNRMHGWAERRFQKALLHLRRDLPECVEDLRETAALKEIVDEVLARVAAGVRASRGAMIVGSRVERSFGATPADVKAWRRRTSPNASVASLDCDPSDALFPMRIALRARHAAAGEPIGWLLLGPRPDSSFYGSDEREALAEVADPVARAVRVVLLREEREAKLTRLVDERIADLERRLAGTLGTVTSDCPK